MVQYALVTNALAFGEFTPGIGGSPGSVTGSSYPVNDFLTDRGFDPADGQLITQADGTEADYEESGIPDRTELRLLIDADGDDVPEFELRPILANHSVIRVDNQISGNMGYFEGEWGIFDLNGGEEPLVIGGGRLFLTTEPGGLSATPTQIVPAPGPALVVADLEVVCFARGVLIDTPEGPRKVEDLSVGDLVLTKDHGAMPVRWIGSRALSERSLSRHPSLRPIRIAAGAFGANNPETDLVLSPQHRVLLSSRIVRTMFGADEVLVPAKKLLGYPGVSQDPTSPIEYFHILLDHHELVRANGCWSETLLLGAMARKMMGPEARREIALLFPEIATPSYVAAPARRIVRSRKVERMLLRHCKNGQTLVEVA